MSFACCVVFLLVVSLFCVCCPCDCALNCFLFCDFVCFRLLFVCVGVFCLLFGLFLVWCVLMLLFLCLVHRLLFVFVLRLLFVSISGSSCCCVFLELFVLFAWFACFLWF